jgi:hypothetical protein
MNQSTAESKAPVVVPGRSIGPVRIGMTRKDCVDAGLTLAPDPSGQLGEAVRVAGPYQMVFQADRVASVTLKIKESRAGIDVNGEIFSATASLEQVAKALPKCGPVEVREGGRVVTCSGGTTLVKSGADDPAVEIQVVAPGFLG